MDSRFVRPARAALLLAAFALPAAAQEASRPRPTLEQKADSAQKIKAVQVIGEVTGTGRTRSLNALPKSALTELTPGTSALRAAEKLPGVNFQSADPQGLYEWSNRITMRGFQTQQIGQTFDGITLGDMSYGNFNGLGVGRAVDAENLEGTSVAQGSGALGTSSSNNLGGVVQYTSGDPANAAQWRLRQLAGSASTRRTWLRWDSGLRGLGEGAGFKMFVSYGRSDADKWKGGGERFSRPADGLLGQKGFLFGTGQTWQDQANLKAMYFAGPHKFTLFYDFDDRKESDYTDLSLARLATSGRNWDQYSDWATALAGAGSATPDEAYFYSAQGARKDHLGYLSADFQLNDATHLQVQPYFHANSGAGDWHAPSYGASWSPDPVYFRQTQYTANRSGVNLRLATSFAGNELEAGAWIEGNSTTIRRVGWRLVNAATGPAVDFNTILRLFFDRTGAIGTQVAYVQNTNTLLDSRLRLTYGIKYLRINADYTNNGDTRPTAATKPDLARPSASFPTDGGILPQAGAVYKVGDGDELFANFAQNVNALPYSPQTGVYNTSPTAFDFFKANTKPERATTYELGWRTRRGAVQAAASLYAIDYQNRLIGVSVCPLTATCVSSYANVGAVATRGVEGLVIWKVLRDLTWQAAGSYNESKIQDNYVSGSATTVPSKDKWVVDAPLVQVNTSLHYAMDGWFASGSARYASARFFSILNDQKVGAFGQIDATAGYRFKQLGAARDLTLQLNVVNVTDRSQISTMGTNGFTLTGDTQTLLAGPPRLVYVSVGTTF